MNKYIDTTKALTIGVSSFITAMFGALGWLAIIYACTIVLDYITGTLAAIKLHCWKSSVARAGIWHKIGCIITIGVAGLTDWTISVLVSNTASGTAIERYTTLICPIVLTWYIITELGSILENAEKLGSNIPTLLSAYLQKFKKRLDSSDQSDENE